MIVGGDKHPISCASDVFVIPPNQTLRLTGYVRIIFPGIDGAVAMKVITPQQQTLFDFSVSGNADSGDPDGWRQFSRTFKTADVPMECRIVLSNIHTSPPWTRRADFDSLSLVSP